MERDIQIIKFRLILGASVTILRDFHLVLCVWRELSLLEAWLWLRNAANSQENHKSPFFNGIFQAGPRWQSSRGTTSLVCCHMLGFLLRVENEELSLGFLTQNVIPERAEGIISSLAEQAMSKEGGESKWGLVIVQPARAGSPQSCGCWKKQGCGQGNTVGFDAKPVLGVSLKVSSTQQLLFHFTSS